MRIKNNFKIYDIKNTPSRLHACSICGKIDIWTHEWCWTLHNVRHKDLDDGELIKLCSEECKTKFEEEKITK